MRGKTLTSQQLPDCCSAYYFDERAKLKKKKKKNLAILPKTKKFKQNNFTLIEQQMHVKFSFLKNDYILMC